MSEQKGTSTLVGFVIIILVVIILLSGFFAYKYFVTQKALNQSSTQNQGQYTNQLQQEIKGIQVTSPQINEQISSPLKIKGVVNGGGWSGFEGQVGNVKLLDDKGNTLTTGVLKATAEWTQPKVEFESTLTFQSKYRGPAILFFSNENPSGLAEKNQNFGLPVVIK